jgi:prepilin-type N-terminal cleavage/methylation domain-containing protein
MIRGSDGRGAGRYWLPLVLGLSLVPVAGVFTASRIFFIRDLSFFFWSRHLWIRHTVLSGRMPWWDPFVAAGQSGIADALNQLMMPVTLAIRLLPSDIVAFNVWVALPLPLAALGMFGFLRRERSAQAAALGACVFALSGPIVSTLNLPNLSWSVALLPWVMWAASDPRRDVEIRAWWSPVLGTRSWILVAIAFALQALCGEPVTWAATGVFAILYSIFRPTSLRQIARVIMGLVAGTLLAAAQLVPTLVAGVAAHRAALATPDFWSLHPLSLWEALAPHVFGNYYDAFLADLPWMSALNFGRDPFLYSIYVGPLVLLLVCAGLMARPRRTAFWGVVALLFLIASLGGYTPLYPLARRLVPALMYFRFPVKYIAFAVFGCAVTAAEGFAWLAESPHDRRIPVLVGSLAAIAFAVSVGALVLPAAVTRVAHALAVATHLKDPAAGAAFLARVAPPLAVRACGLLMAGCILMAVAAGRGRAARGAAIALLSAVCADLLITNSRLNLTMEAAKLRPPSWYTASAGPERVYIGGRVRGYMNGGDPDGTPTWQIPAEPTAIEGRMVLNASLPMAPSGWGVREALSYDLPYLWPHDYDDTVRRFEQATRDERDAFLRRSGVRWCVLPASQRRPWRPIADVPDWNMRVYECDPDATRIFIAAIVQIAHDSSDLAWQREALFDPKLPDDIARLDRMPAAAGREGSPEPAMARFIDEGTTTVAIEAHLPRAGVLVLRDSYDPSWTSQVDGTPADIVRANGRYRAVRLPPGRHVIRFAYRPRGLRIGLTMSLVTLGFIGFVGFNRFGVRTQNRNPLNPKSPLSPSDGFTLLELMIVLAIISALMAVAFTEYRGMQAKGNDVSALSSIRSIATAQWQFALTCGNLKYAATLPALGQPVPSTGHAFLSPDLTAGNSFEKSGYMFQMAAKPLENSAPACNGVAVADGYAATADPMKPGVSGGHFYGVNADRILYTDEQQSFAGNLPESGAPSHGAEVK